MIVCMPPHVADVSLTALGVLWPAMLAQEVSEVSAAIARGLITIVDGGEHAEPRSEPGWVTPNDIILELESVRLRRFGQPRNKRPVLIVAPFALHAATLADLARGHSLIEVLQSSTEGAVYISDWRSANRDRASRGIDDYLADLNVLVDEVGGTVDLVGLCQGGWMGLAYAARFPRKIGKLVLAGAPIDIAAQQTVLSRVARTTPISVFREMVALGQGVMSGRWLFQFWQPQSLDIEVIRSTLQIEDSIAPEVLEHLQARFRDWYEWTLDLPGRFYLETVERIYLNNELAAGTFIALGRRIDLTCIRVPIFLLAACNDQVVAPAQTLAVRHLVGTSPGAIHCAVSLCEHLGLFMGSRTLANEWHDVGCWLREPATIP